MKLTIISQCMVSV